MSDSDDLSTPANIPPDSEIEACLHRVVRLAVQKEEEITIKLARSRAEAELGIESGFFKDNDAWKQKSKDIISAAVEEAESPAKPKAKPAAKAGTKRKSDEAPTQKEKRAKKLPEVKSEDDAELQDGKDFENGDALPAASKSEHDSALSDAPDDLSEQEPAAAADHKIPDDDSDLSSVIDDPPPKKKRQKKSTSPSATKSKPAKTSKASKPDSKAQSTSKGTGKELSPDEEEVKKLQSWLLKCGIRKLWHRELAPYSTSKEKVQHLKKMLDDVGMKPRYSNEKARDIKEARELKDEIEAAKNFNEQWGDGQASGNEDEDQAEKEADLPTRRLKPKGLIDFGDSDEESD